jgi:hypothetical protein
MFYYFKDKHRLSEAKLEFKGQNYMFNSYEMELYSVGVFTPSLCTRDYLPINNSLCHKTQILFL